MSGAISISTMAMIAAGTFVATKVLAPKPQQAPQMPAAAEAPKMPQTSKVPDQRPLRASSAGAAGASGAMAGPAGTMLTGAGGVAPGALNLGKNTLLGA